MPAVDTRTFLDLATDLAREAGKLALERRKTLGPARAKGVKDLVTEADIECDRLIRARIAAAFPAHDLLTEEEGALDHGGEYRWIVDPIDGTVNYSRGLPLWGNSIALTHRGATLCGAIYLPVFDEMFTAVAGEGAFLNGARLRVSDVADPDALILSHGDYNVGPDHPTRLALNAENYAAHARLAEGALRVKCLGSSVVEGSYVASGRLDGYFMTTLKPWDVAVTSLLVAEAGGRVTELSGAPWALESRTALFSNGVAHDALVRALDWNGKRERRG
jgi:myo-inositol-1(or 4)-monophosphatase